MSFFERYELNWFIGWWLVGCGWIILVWYLSLSTIPPKIDTGSYFSDKIGHFIAYAWLMFWFGNLYKDYRARLFFAGVFVLMGIGLEILQGMGQVRQFEYYDILANSAGVLISFILLFTSMARLFSWIEHFFKKEYDET